MPLKNKIINDPVYGFISIPNQLCYDLIEHPYFQRLRNIKQLGLAHFVYPGAQHTRFQHSIGAMFLMGEALNVLKSKGQDISNEEEESALAAILLHDIGHGPFSHTLERNLLPDSVTHEDMSLIFMNKLNQAMNGRLSMAIDIFTDQYPKHFIHSLISGQLDMDRMDFLRRDSYFTGVVEGTINSDRIIKMLVVSNDQLAVEAKGIYSIERFLTARRLMYWQVYMHKTVVSAEQNLGKILQRAHYLTKNGENLVASPALDYFLQLNTSDFDENMAINQFSELGDEDILMAVKMWAQHKDKVLSLLCRSMIYRQLNRVLIKTSPFEQSLCESIKDRIATDYNLSLNEADFITYTGKLHNEMYKAEAGGIKIWSKNGETKDIIEASDLESMTGLTQLVEKYFLSAPKAFI